jgi:Mrp family chromosome partitioning ATPase
VRRGHSVNARAPRMREWKPNWAFPAAIALNMLGTPLAFVAIATLAGLAGAAYTRSPAWAFPVIAGGGALLFLATWYLRARRRVIYTVDRLPLQIGAGVFGGAPGLTERSLRLLPPDRRSDFGLVSERPEAPLAVALRAIFDRVTRAFGPGGQVVTVSEVRDGKKEGSFALSLAVTAAGKGMRVLVVDGDLHLRGLSRTLEQSEAAGVWDVISYQADWRTTVSAVEFLGIDFLPAGSESRAIREAYGDARFANLLNELRGAYDVVVIETPAVLKGPDARMTAAFADVAVLVATWGRTSLLDARRAVNALGERAPHIRLGVAVVDIEDSDNPMARASRVFGV